MQSGLNIVQIRKLRAALAEILAIGAEWEEEDERAMDLQGYGGEADFDQEQRREGEGDSSGPVLLRSYDDDYPSPVSTIPEGSQEGETESERDENSPYPRSDSPRGLHLQRSQSAETDAGETVVFEPGPLGLRIESNVDWGVDGVDPIRSIFAVMVEGFNRQADGSLSTAEGNGNVRPGDFIVAVEGAPTAGMCYEDVIARIQSCTRPMALTFCGPELLAQEVVKATGGSPVAQDADESMEPEPTMESDDDSSQASASPLAQRADPAVGLSHENATTSVESGSGGSPGEGAGGGQGGASPGRGKGGLSPLGGFSWENELEGMLGDKYSSPSKGQDRLAEGRLDDEYEEFLSQGVRFMKTRRPLSLPPRSPVYTPFSTPVCTRHLLIICWLSVLKHRENSQQPPWQMLLPVRPVRFLQHFYNIWTDFRLVFD